MNGAGAAVALAIPVLLTAVPLFVRRRPASRPAVFVSAGVLGVLVVISGFSIGAFYGPSAVALGVAAVLELRRPAAA